MKAVIYIFQCPKGRVYAGWHGVSPEALRTWPHKGLGPLPCGYTGSGNPWRHIARRHRDALTWRIVARVDGTQSRIDAAEVRAIHLARLIFGRRCMNVLAGGQGVTSADARAFQARPEVKAKSRATNARPEVAARRSAAIREAIARPDVKARRSAAQKEAQNRPDVKAKQRAAQMEAQNRPDVKARKSLANALTAKAWAATPEGKAQLSRAAQIGARKRRARKALAPLIQPPVIAHPGVTVWAFRPGISLGITGPFHNKGKKARHHSTQSIVA